MKTYRGSCHCGTVEYDVELDVENQNLMECNCTICSRVGWKVFFVPESAFTLLAGEGATTDYQFAKKNLHHPFCTTCGVRSYSWGPGHDGAGLMYAINARCLKDLDLAALETTPFDGASV